MSRPLIIVLQLVGGGMLIYGFAPPPNWALTIIGLIILLMGSVAFRKRYGRGPKPSNPDMVYCHECSKAGGAERPIYHEPPACN